MDSQTSSPDRAAVKVKYSRKHKRDSSTVSVTQGTLDGGEATESKNGAVETPSQRGPKKVDVHLPGPEPSPASTPAKDKLKRKRSSIAKRDPAYKPGAESPDDDASSIAESSTSLAPRMRRTEPERKKIFEDDPHCDQFEEHRAHCSKCDKWISLGKKPTYAVRPWLNHIQRCVPGREQAAVMQEQAAQEQVAQEQAAQEQAAQEEAEEEQEAEDAASVVAPSVAGKLRTTEAERRAVLEADPMVAEARPHEVLCKNCHRWIKLATGRVYVLGNWNRHRESCVGKSQPSGRVAMAQRKLNLVNDPLAHSFTARSVECASCGETVTTEKDSPDYDLTKWQEHKGSCVKRPRSPRSPPQTNGTSTKTRAAPVSPPSAPVRPASDETPKEVSPDRGQKRPRETEDGDAESRPQNRPRTADYEAPQQEAPGPWGWFLLPFKTFIRGFREGLSGGSS